MSRWALVIACAACGIRAPAPIDVDALVAKRGAVEARRDLEIRILADPKAIQARLALAELAYRNSRPGEALEQLEAVRALGGPFGTRWHGDDRHRYMQLLLGRAEEELRRGSPHALVDLEHARELGAPIQDYKFELAREAVALAELRHVDAEMRARGRELLAQSHPATTPAQHGAFGVWLWAHGARREAYEQLVAWHSGTPAPRDGKLEDAYLAALGWWLPVDAPPPSSDELAGHERCFEAPSACSPPQRRGRLLARGPLEAAAVNYVYARVHGAIGGDAFVAIVRAFARDPAIAERLGREFVGTSWDPAVAHAQIGALFDALADPARARANWQAAVDASPEPEFVRGLAEACARMGDGPAAAVFATRAAAAWGDPAIVWIGVARALLDSGRYPDALAAAHSALELAGREDLPRALAIATAASRALGRTAQADELAVRAPHVPDDLAAALAAHEAHPTAATVAQLWVVSRGHVDDVASRAAIYAATSPGDPRRAAVASELALLAGGVDGLAAVQALRPP
ncbi:MAG TPA: hypothetical protein VMJ10_24430 [Kofleriaceae bacterium]|nr:hypothetical protein [Kofleriaceae bacterium]